MSIKYPNLDDYNYSDDIIKEFEKIVEVSSRSDYQKPFVKLNELLIANNGNSDEVETLGINIWTIIEDLKQINKIPKTIKDFNGIDLEFKNVSNQQLMEFMIRVGHYTKIRFNSSIVPKGSFNNILNNYNSDVTSCLYDNIVNPLIRKQFLIGFKNWLDNQTYPNVLIEKVIKDIKRKDNKELFRSNHSIIYKDTKFNYGINIFQGFDDSNNIDIIKKEFLFKNLSLDEAFVKLSLEFYQEQEEYKRVNNLPKFEPIDKYLFCCEVGNIIWGKYNINAKNNNLKIGENIGTFFEIV